MLTRVASWVWITGVLVSACGGSCGGERDRPEQRADASTVQPGGGGGASAATLDFPADHRLRQDQSAKDPARAETLRFSGVLTRQGTDQGIGYSVALTQLWSAERARFEYVYGVTIAEPDGEEVARESCDLLGAPRIRSDRKTGELIWTFTQGAMRIWHKEQNDVWEIRINNGKSGNQLVAGWLTLKNESQGYQPDAEEGKAGLGYFHPSLVTRGNLTFGGESVPVSGASRFEHFFGDSSEFEPASAITR